ncbi:MAG: hypothetical protein LBH56_01200 [Coriobacteriales bacterium]|nr:hypothetical protein [Coriobacteriales bacterium]
MPETPECSGIISAFRQYARERTFRERVFDERVILMVLAGALGAFVGLIGFIPLLLAQRFSRRGSRQVRRVSIQLAMVVVGADFILLLVALFVVSKLVPDVLLVFGVAMVVAFLGANLLLALGEQKR